MKIDGKEIALKIKDEVRAEIEKLEAKPRLAVIQVGNDPASNRYVASKEKACMYCGIDVDTYHFPEDVSEYKLIWKIEELCDNENVHGILVQLPLPKHINVQNVINAIDYEKDVDGLSNENVAKLAKNDTESRILPCTANGVMKLLDTVITSYEGKSAVVIGRSDIVGKPVAKLLQDANCTVTVCHSKTPLDQLKFYCKNADIIVSAMGKINAVPGCKIGAVIVDVGINHDETGKLIGDVDPFLYQYASAYTSVPGGVGPMTIAILMYNVLKCYKIQKCLE